MGQIKAASPYFTREDANLEEGSNTAKVTAPADLNPRHSDLKSGALSSPPHTSGWLLPASVAAGSLSKSEEAVLPSDSKN